MGASNGPVKRVVQQCVVTARQIAMPQRTRARVDIQLSPPQNLESVDFIAIQTKCLPSTE